MDEILQQQNFLTPITAATSPITATKTGTNTSVTQFVFLAPLTTLIVVGKDAGVFVADELAGLGLEMVVCVVDCDDVEDEVLEEGGIVVVVDEVTE